MNLNRSCLSDKHEGCETCLEVLQSLENIDDDTDRQEIKLVKTTDRTFAEQAGLVDLPGLVFFHEEVGGVSQHPRFSWMFGKSKV